MERQGQNIGTYSFVPVLLLLIGGGISFLLFDNLKSNAIDENIEAFDDFGQVITGTISSKLDRILIVMRGTAAFFEGSEDLTEEKFREYVRKVIRPQPEFRAVSWVPFVRNEEREEFELNVRASGHEHFEINERNRENEAVRVGERALYYPVTYIEPLIGNEETLGFDLGSDLQRLMALGRLFETRMTVATESVQFLQLEDEGPGVLILEPILGEVEQGVRPVTGIIRGVLEIAEVIKDRGSFRTDQSQITRPNIYLIDVTDASEPTLLYAGDNTRINPFENPLQQLRRDNDYRSEYAIRVADRDWLLFLAPQDRLSFARTPLEIWLVLILGLTISTMLAGYIYRLQHEKLSTEFEIEKKNTLLNDRQRLFSSIVDTAIDGIITMDEFGIIETYNRAAAKIFGYSQEEIVGQNIETLFGKKYGQFNGRFVQDFVATGKLPFIGAITEVDGRRKDGSEFSMELAASEVIGQYPRRFTGIIRDISAKKQIEKMKEEFISTVSHELRTPLTSIYGSIELARSGQIKDPDEITRILGLASRNSERLIQIVNDLLDMEKLQSFKAEFKFRNILLSDVIENAVRLNQSYADNYNVKLEILHVPKTAYVHGDLSRLTQVLTNLISNAVKYSPKNDTVSIMVSTEDNNYRVEIKDNGPGVPKSFMPRMFDRFAQADSSDTRAKSGTGLGLAISKEIIERHSGTIGYEPNSPSGSIFYFTIPIANKTETDD